MNSQNIKWKAEWIESDICGGPRTSCPAPYFRHTFELQKKPKQALLHITALGLYEASVNGTTAHDAVLTPGWTRFDRRVRFQSWDVTDLLNQGENVIGVILGDGWFCGHVATHDRQFYGDRPKLLAQLEWTDQDGDRGLLVTDRNWRFASGPILENDLIMGEAYDARKELDGWDRPGFNDSQWRRARIAQLPPMNIEPQYGPLVRRHEEIKAVQINPHPLLFDLKQNISGRVRISVKGPAGANLRLRHGEMLDEDGNIYTENLRSARAEDYYTLKGQGTETWEPRFTFHGFRYVEVTWTNPSKKGTVESLTGLALYSDMAMTGDFRCSHPKLNRLYENTVWSQKGNFLEIPTDCPQRDERLGWTGDAQVFIRTAAFNMDVSGFFRKWMQDLRDTQYENGAIPPTAPFLGSFDLPADGGPAWADAMLICPMELYRACGDIDFIADNYDGMAAYMEYLAENKVKDGIRGHRDLDGLGGFGDWLALDGSGRTDGGTPKDLIGTAFYANNARIMRDSARLLAKTGDEQRWDDLHQQIVSAFRERFLTPAGLPAAGTQTACVLALHFDLAAPEQKPLTVEHLVHLIEKNGTKIGTGFVGTPYLLHVLEAGDRLDIAYKLLEQEEFPSWLFPVNHGATTIWERWDGWTPRNGFQSRGMNSFNHYAYGAVCDWMVGSLAGLQPDSPGYKRIRFQPKPGGSISSASAKLQTRYGPTAISWTLKEEGLNLELTVPPGASAVLKPPTGWETEEQTELEPGEHEVRCRPER